MLKAVISGMSFFERKSCAEQGGQPFDYTVYPRNVAISSLLWTLHAFGKGIESPFCGDLAGVRGLAGAALA